MTISYPAFSDRAPHDRSSKIARVDAYDDQERCRASEQSRAPKADVDHDRRRSALVQGRSRLSVARQVVHGRQRRRHRRLRRSADPKLDYIASLGVNTIWLLPFYPSPRRDDGYDIAEYTGVHPDYGTMADVKRFIHEAHKRNLRVITELVINHTSDQHPWFQKAACREAGLCGAQLLRVVRQRPDLRGHADHLLRHGEVQLDVGPGRRRVLLAPLLLASARPQLRQPAGDEGGAST